MKYMGSKSRIVKEIAPIIQSYIDSTEKKSYIMNLFAADAMLFNILKQISVLLLTIKNI